jgi:hypothetical protein
MGSPSPKSQHGGNVPTFEAQETIENIIILSLKLGFDYFFQKYHWGLVSRVGSRFLFDPQVMGITFIKCCHVGIHVILQTWDLGPV